MMPVINDRAEQLISDYHRENFEQPDIQNVEWIGEMMYCDELVDFYIVTASSDRFRYYYDKQDHRVIDCEPDWN